MWDIKSESSKLMHTCSEFILKTLHINYLQFYNYSASLFTHWETSLFFDSLYSFG